jgi:hypothetical protein
MAGRGPAPKEGRRRANAPARGDWVDLSPLEHPVLPPLPDLEGAEWAAGTLATWDAWMSDPVSAQWSPSDVAYALDTILLHNVMTPGSASEVRLRMDSLGLTPKGKRDLRWRLAAADEKPETLQQPATVRKLRAVG